MKKFITFEGMDGSGKSTQVELLGKSLKKINEDCFLTREPGGTTISEKIRSILVNETIEDIKPKTELLLIYAARHQHIKEKLLPNLKKRIVICDRFYHSTFCYQILSNSIPFSVLESLHKTFADNLYPDITFFIDTEPKISINRSLKIKNNEKRFELKKHEYHKVVYNGFLDFVNNNNNFFKVDGNEKIMKIHQKIIDILNKKKITKLTIPYCS